MQRHKTERQSSSSSMQRRQGWETTQVLHSGLDLAVDVPLKQGCNKVQNHWILARCQLMTQTWQHQVQHRLYQVWEVPGREKGHGEAKRDRLALRVNPYISRKGQQKGGVPDPLDFHGIPSGTNIKANKMHSSCYGFYVTRR